MGTQRNELLRTIQKTGPDLGRTESGRFWAVLGGSGSFAITNAIKQNADAYISADFKYHDFFKAEGKILLTDVGHYESEQFTKNLLVEHLTKKFISFAPRLEKSEIILSEKSTNPIYYL